MKRRVWGPYQNIVKDDLNDIGTFAQEAVEMALAAITPPARLSGLQASAISSNTVKVTAGWMVVYDSTVGRPRLGVLAGDTNLTVSGAAGTYLVVATVSEQDLESRTVSPPPQTLPNGQPNPFYDPTLNPYNQVTLKGWQVSLSLRPGSYTPANREAVVAQVTWNGSAITGVTQVLDWPKLNIADRSIPAIKIADDLAGNGTSRNASGGIQVNVDNSTVEISSNTLRVKDGGITDAKLGNRTISDGTSPSSDTGTLTSLLSGLANRIKAITGETTWRNAPATTIGELNANVARKGNNETITGAWTFTGGITIAKPTTGDNAYIARISFPAPSGGNNPAYIEHRETTADVAELRISISDNDGASNDRLYIGSAPSGIWKPRVAIDTAGKFYWGDGSGTFDADLYRSGAGTLSTSGTLTVNGNLGVGTTSPAYKLDVSGDVRWTGTLQGGTVPWARLSGYPSVNAGTGLTGGGSLSGNITLNLATDFIKNFSTGTPSAGDFALIGPSSGSTNYKVPIGPGVNRIPFHDDDGRGMELKGTQSVAHLAGEFTIAQGGGRWFRLFQITPDGNYQGARGEIWFGRAHDLPYVSSRLAYYVGTGALPTNEARLALAPGLPAAGESGTGVITDAAIVQVGANTYELWVQAYTDVYPVYIAWHHHGAVSDTSKISYAPLQAASLPTPVSGGLFIRWSTASGSSKGFFVSTESIADNAVTNAKIAANAVQTLQIADGAVTNAKISVSNAKIPNLNADLLDGYDSTDFTRKAENATITGAWTFTSALTVPALQGNGNADLLINAKNRSMELRIDEDNTDSDALRITKGPNGGTELLRVLSSGRVGIGTSNPAGTLHVAGDVLADLYGASGVVSLGNLQYRNVVGAITPPAQGDGGLTGKWVKLAEIYIPSSSTGIQLRLDFIRSAGVKVGSRLFVHLGNVQVDGSLPEYVTVVLENIPGGFAPYFSDVALVETSTRNYLVLGRLAYAQMGSRMVYYGFVHYSTPSFSLTLSQGQATIYDNLPSPVSGGLNFRWSSNAPYINSSFLPVVDPGTYYQLTGEYYPMQVGEVAIFKLQYSPGPFMAPIKILPGQIYEISGGSLDASGPYPSLWLYPNGTSYSNQFREVLTLGTYGGSSPTLTSVLLGAIPLSGPNSPVFHAILDTGNRAITRRSSEYVGGSPPLQLAISAVIWENNTTSWNFLGTFASTNSNNLKHLVTVRRLA